MISLTVCESVCMPCVSETTIGGLSAACTRRRTMSAGRCAWIKLCIGSLLHCPFSASLCYPSTSTFPPRLHLGRVFFFFFLGGEIMAVTIASIVSEFFCEAMMGLCALCLSLHTSCSVIYRLALRALEGSRDRGGGRYRWSMDQPWIVSPQNKM